VVTYYRWSNGKNKELYKQVLSTFEIRIKKSHRFHKGVLFLKPLFGRGYPRDKVIWESQYASSHWDYLSEQDEMAHYGVITGYLKHGASILDIGCGEGILQKRLTSSAYSRYIGIDISEEAIKRAPHTGDDKTLFIVSDGEDYMPSDNFDAIIFNEALYYFDRPLQILNKYEKYLKNGGVFIISISVSALTSAIWRKIESEYHVIDETKVTNKKGRSWVCKVLKP
jgi:2-polyprenyl-3-methyl-5-hydroxy-6-metoxy-1,4-benzoquinol methylase